MDGSTASRQRLPVAFDRPGAQPLVGRRHELRILRDALTGGGPLGDQSPGCFVVVRGEGGIGKSALIETALAQAAGDRPVLRASADVMDRRRPFGVLLDAFGSLFARNGDRPIGEQGEYALGERLLAAVDELAGQPSVLVLEDLQWADSASLALLGRLSRTLAQLPIVIIGSLPAREVPDSAADLGRLLELMRQRDVLTVIELGPLSTDECVEIAQRLTGARAEGALLTHIAAAGGNPLFLTEMLRALASEGSLSGGGAGAPSLEGMSGRSPSLAMVIMHHLSFLSARTRELLALAALLGTRFPAGHLRVVADQPMSSLLPSLREAIAAGVLEDTADGMLGFRHGLIQQVLIEDLPVAVRAELQREVAARLEAVDVAAVTVAAHLLRAHSSPEDLPWMARLAERTASASPATSSELWERVRAATSPGDPLNARASAGLAQAALRAGRAQEAVSVAREALQYDAPVDALARLSTTLTHALLFQGQQALARDEAERAALSRVLEPVDRARHLAFAGWPRFMLGDVSGAGTRAREAAALAVEVGDPAAQVLALVLQGHIANCRGDLDEAIATLGEAVVLTDRHPSLEALEAFPHAQAATALADVDRLDQAVSLLDRARRVSEQFSYVTGVFSAYTTGAVARAHSANLSDLDSELDARDSLLDVIDVRLEPALHGLRVHVAVHQRGPDAGLPWMRLLDPLPERSAWPGRGRSWIWRAVSQAERWRRDDAAALAVLWRGWEDCSSTDLLMDCAELGLDLAVLTRQVDRTPRGRSDLDGGKARERIQEVVEVLDALAARNPAVTHLRATALAVGGVVNDVPDALLEAAQLLATTPRRLEYARTAELAALALAGRRRSDAQVQAEAALDAYAEIGADHDVVRGRVALRQAGIGLRRQPRMRPTTGWEALTRTEKRIALQVATGASNPEIAELCYLSRRTVESHVSHVLAKLGLRSRIELALFVSQRAGDLGEQGEQVDPPAEALGTSAGRHAAGRRIRVVEPDLDQHRVSLAEGGRWPDP